MDCRKLSDIKKEEISVKIYKVNNSIEEKDNISWYYMLISGLSLLFMLLIFQLFYSQKITNFMFGKEPKNILIYIINILIFISVCVFISMVAKNIIDFKQKTIKESHILKKGLYISAISLTMCSIFIMFISMYINASKVRYSESGHFIWREWKQTILLIFTVVLTISFILLFENYKKLSLPKIASILLALFCFAYTFYCMCYGNYIPSTPYLLHTNAIFESVYNYYYDIPKSDINFSIYGHYGLLLNFIFKIIGLSGKKFVFVMAFITAICVLCIVLTIFNITKNLFVRIAASLSALYLFSFMYVPTYQIIIRIVFPAVMLAYLSFIVRYKFVKRKWSVAGSYFLAALAFTWNTETGLVILISIVFFYCYIAFCEYNLKQLKFYICVLKQILYFVLSISAVFLFVNIYNFIIGGHFISIEVFSPSLMSGDYIKSLVLPLFNDLGPNVPWVYNFSLILIVLGLGIAHCLASSKKINNASHYAFITTVSIMTIGCFTYYINRPAYGNLYDTYLVSILLIVILADHCLNNIIVFNKRTVSSILQRSC